jgi:hypothetical protein
MNLKIAAMSLGRGAGSLPAPVSCSRNFCMPPASRLLTSEFLREARRKPGTGGVSPKPGGPR